MKKIKRNLFVFNENTLKYQQVGSFREFMFRNPFLWVLPFLIVICVLVAVMVAKESKSKMEYEILSSEYEGTITELNREIDADSLVIKIGRAILEGRSTAKPTDSAVYAYICECRAWYPDYIMAQYKIESSSGTSNVAVNANNFFGMRPVSGKRKNFTTQKLGDNYNGYAVYDNWHLSVIDKILWEQFRFGGVKPDENTYQESHKQYAEDEEYLNKIKKMIKVLEDERKMQEQ